jgi:hypothetical protein
LSAIASSLAQIASQYYSAEALPEASILSALRTFYKNEKKFEAKSNEILSITGAWFITKKKC